MSVFYRILENKVKICNLIPNLFHTAYCTFPCQVTVENKSATHGDILSFSLECDCQSIFGVINGYLVFLFIK